LRFIIDIKHHLVALIVSIDVEINIQIKPSNLNWSYVFW